MKKIIILIYSLFIIIHSMANTKKEISIGHKGMTFIEMTEELQNKYQIHSFFDKAWVENIKLKKSYSQTELHSLISDILSETQLQFIIRGNNLILTKYNNLSQEFNLLKKDSEYEEVQQNPKYESNTSSLQQQEYSIHEIGVALGHKRARFFGNINLLGTDIPLMGVEVFLPTLKKGVTSDKNGYFELELPQGSYIVHFKHMGLKQTSRKINLCGDGRLDVQMRKEVRSIDEINVLAKDNKIKRTAMGLEHFTSKEIESLPTALGEPDIIKSTTMLPGVESAGEGSIGFNVRGGSTDQNLILIDNAPIYYPAHFFGFFSAFNNDMIQDASLYKSSVPVQFGGRVSSVYDIQTSESIADKISGKAGISPITSKAYLNLPLLKKKLAIVNSFRFTYSDWIIKKIDSKELENSKAKFNDLHGKILYKPNANNHIELNYYKSYDEFQLQSDTIYNFNNFISSINWRHRFSEELKMMSSTHFSSFSYDMCSEDMMLNAFKLTHSVKDIGIKTHFNYNKNVYTSFDFGADAKYYDVSPGDLKPNSETSLIAPKKIQNEKALETALFAGVKTDIFDFLTAEAGIRYSLYGNLGKRDEMTYKDNVTSSYNSLEKVSTSGGLNNIYQGPEYRLSLSCTVNNKTSIKASYNRTRQYIHLLSNTTSVSPTDTWKLTDRYLKPQVGDQISLGFYHNFSDPKIEFSVEAYSKKLKNAKDYKNGAELFLNEYAETEVLNADGKNYGVEILLRKKKGRFNGIISYSYSRSFLKTKDKTGEFAVNKGNWYRAPYDKPHNYKAFFSFKISRRFIFSTNMVYHTGRPATFPSAKYMLRDLSIIHFSKRNEYRLPNYFRTDITLLLEGNLKKNKTYHTSWSFGIYNLTGRKNTYSAYFRLKQGEMLGYKMSILGEAIPTITYNIEF